MTAEAHNDVPPIETSNFPKGVIGGYLFGLALAEQIAQAARRDELTGALNKSAFGHELEESVAKDEDVGVAFIDLDSFKQVNDTFGHAAGDELLQDFINHMNTKFRRKEDITEVFDLSEEEPQEGETGRLGGDEFGIKFALKNARRGQNPKVYEGYTRDAVQEFVDRQPEKYRRLGFGASIGVAIRRKGENKSAADLVAEADAAMFKEKKAKGAGR